MNVCIYLRDYQQQLNLHFDSFLCLSIQNTIRRLKIPTGSRLSSVRLICDVCIKLKDDSCEIKKQISKIFGVGIASLFFCCKWTCIFTNDACNCANPYESVVTKSPCSIDWLLVANETYIRAVKSIGKRTKRRDDEKELQRELCEKRRSHWAMIVLNCCAIKKKTKEDRIGVRGREIDAFSNEKNFYYS